MHARRSSRSTLAVVLVGGIVGCSAASSPEEGSEPVVASSSSDGGSEGGSVGGSDGEPAASSGEPEAPDACADACLEPATPQGAATCHSCRCKLAFDGWLPTTDELQCKHGEPIVTYHAELSETDYVLEPTALGAMDCANPSLLTGSCRQGSKLGQLTHGDVSMYWVCRDPYLDYDGTVLYHDMAVIGHNRRTGATCFWDDENDLVHEDDAPPLDLAEASEEERDRAIAWFPYNDGSRCVTCHDHDPFLYTPYLQSTTWESVAASKGPYHLVGLDGAPRPTGVMELVSPAASPCTSCHRLGSNETCSFFAPDALAAHKGDRYEAQVHAAAEPGSPHWPLAYWMPGPTQAFASFSEWDSIYGAARAHILACCEAPGVDVNGCQWQPVPAE